jgi:hypothetical protein
MATWKMVEQIGTSLPETTVGLWYRKPALVIGGKGFLHLSDGEELSFPSPDKEALVATQPDVYRSTPHHDGTPWLLGRLAKISKKELREHLADAWRMKAPREVRNAHPDV